MSRQSSVPMSAGPDTVAAMSETAATVAVLDPAQQRVCELPAEANAVVVGGPGSGKTTALIERAASLAAQTGWSPDHLLVLTANRLAAAELRDRLALRLGTPSAGPIARSAASVAFSVVQAQRQAPVTLLTGTEHDSLIAELLLGEIADGTDHYWPATLPPEARQLRGFRSELREFLMRVEELGVQPGQLRALAEAHGRAEWGAVARFIEVYTGPKFGAHPGQFDAAELGAFAARILSEASGDAGPLDELRVVLVDDAQEATQSTISLLRALASRGSCGNGVWRSGCREQRFSWWSSRSARRLCVSAWRSGARTGDPDRAASRWRAYSSRIRSSCRGYRNARNRRAS